MPTNEDKREVARRIRMGSPDWVGDHYEKWLGPTFGTIVLSGGGKDEIESAARHLADLIDHEDERTCHIEPDPDDPDVEKPWHSCGNCGYTRSIDDWSEWAFCPNCGAKVVDE